VYLCVLDCAGTGTSPGAKKALSPMLTRLCRLCTGKTVATVEQTFPATKDLWVGIAHAGALAPVHGGERTRQKQTRRLATREPRESDVYYWCGGFIEATFRHSLGPGEILGISPREDTRRSGTHYRNLGERERDGEDRACPECTLMLRWIY
jgi:hypothetical protein